MTPKTPEKEKSLSELHPEVEKPLGEAGLLKGKTKHPKLSTVLDAREEDIKLATEKGEKRRKDKKTTYTCR